MSELARIHAHGQCRSRLTLRPPNKHLFCKLFLAMLMVGSISGAIVNAGPLEDGLAAYRRDDFATAMRLLRPLADQGDAVAQARLGLLYQLGEGVPQDYAEAVKWYRLAADQGL